MLSGRERRNRMVALVLIGVLVAGVLVSLIATVAGAQPLGSGSQTTGYGVAYGAAVPAHAGLVDVVPADGARLDTAPTQVVLTFDAPVGADLAQVVLTRDGQPVATGEPSVAGTVLTVQVVDPATPGDYRLAWRVVSDDGHPVSGESTFTVLPGAAGSKPAAGGAPVPRVTPSYKTPQTQPTTFGHPDHLPGLFVAGILLLCGIALLVYEHRRRRAGDLGEDTEEHREQRIS